MSETEINNAWRANTAQKVMDTFIKETDLDNEDAPGDLLANLMHWCDRENYDFNLALERARIHHAEESRQEGTGEWAARVQREPRDTKRQR